MGSSFSGPGAGGQNTQEQLFGGYHDNSTPTSVTPEEMYGDPHQWAAGSLLPSPDTWLAVSPPIMPDWGGAVEPPDGLEAELELLFPDQPEPETETQEVLLSAYTPISENTGCRGYPELLFGDCEDSEDWRESSGSDHVSTMSLLDWALVTDMFPEHTPLDTHSHTYSTSVEHWELLLPQNVFHHNAWACQNGDAACAALAAGVEERGVA